MKHCVLILLLLIMAGCGDSSGEEKSFNCNECTGNFKCNVEQTACICQSGFKGDQCDQKISNCPDVDPCQNGGGCVSLDEGYRCDCLEGFGGDHCENSGDYCWKQPCLNGGNCINEAAGYRCKCADEYSGKNCKYHENDYFITVWKTDLPGISGDKEAIIPVNPDLSYNYDIDCDGDGVFEATGVTDSYTCQYDTPGDYTIKIGGDFTHLKFENESDSGKLITVDQWGTIEWTSMERAFYGCSNLMITAKDTPDLSRVEHMKSMFENATYFNSPIGHWDVSYVKDFDGMFRSATSFNQDLSRWDVDQVKSCNDFALNANSWSLPKPALTCQQ